MYNLSQGQIFIIFVIIGICIGVFFDIFRAFRKTFKISDFFTNLQDISFMAIVGIIIVNSLIIFNNGELRFFIILAILFGISFYFLSISKLILTIFQFLMKFLKKIVLFPIFFKKSCQKRKDFK